MRAVVGGRGSRVLFFRQGGCLTKGGLVVRRYPSTRGAGASSAGLSTVGQIGDGGAGDDAGGAGPGRSTNSDLPNFARSDGLGLLDAVKLVSGIRPLYLGVDTADFSFQASEEEVQGSAWLLDKLIGQGEVDNDGKRFVVSRVGGFVHRYKLAVADGVEMKFPAPEVWWMPVQVHVGARLCLGTEDIEALVVGELVDWFGLRPEEVRKRLRMSRVDVALDVLMTEAQFQRHSRMVGSQSSYVVSRGHSREAYQEGGRYTGFAVGRDDVRLRFYDKTVKAQSDGTWDMWSEAYGQGESFSVPDGYVVARIEWQLRRGFLGQLQADGLPEGVRTLDEFRSVAPGVLRYLATEWFRFAHQARGHEHTRKMLPLWADVADLLSLSRWSELGREVRRRCARLVAANMERLEKMAAGCMAAMAAIIGRREGWMHGASPVLVVERMKRHIEKHGDRFREARDRRFKTLTYGRGAGA